MSCHTLIPLAPLSNFPDSLLLSCSAFPCRLWQVLRHTAVHAAHCLDLSLDNVIAVGSLDGSLSVLTFGDKEGPGGNLRHRDAP